MFRIAPAAQAATSPLAPGWPATLMSTVSAPTCKRLAGAFPSLIVALKRQAAAGRRSCSFSLRRRCSSGVYPVRTVPSWAAAAGSAAMLARHHAARDCISSSPPPSAAASSSRSDMSAATAPASRSLVQFVASSRLACTRAPAALSRAARVCEESRPTSGTSRSRTRIATLVGWLALATCSSTRAACAGLSVSDVARRGRSRFSPPCKRSMSAADSSRSTRLQTAPRAATCSSAARSGESIATSASMAPASRSIPLLVSLRATAPTQKAAVARVSGSAARRKPTSGPSPCASRVAAADLGSRRQMLAKQLMAVVCRRASSDWNSVTMPSMAPSRRQACAAGACAETYLSASTAPSCTSSAEAERRCSSLDVTPRQCMSSGTVEITSLKRLVSWHSRT
mmetsp:Transcript_48780/g.161621  ORF Transcript_48780/g.161621 Transcript_48780/m.161621 type:complete len:397 (+) Transcript_48780:1564-2754(+)